MVEADLKTLVNEAALLAAGRMHDRVSMDDFTDALEKVVLGTARPMMLSPEERERSAISLRRVALDRQVGASAGSWT